MEDKKKIIWKTALITGGLDLVILALAALFYSKDQYGILGVLIVMASLLFLQFLGGLIAAIPVSSRPYGQGMLLGTLIIGLLGLGVCTVAAFA